MSVKKAIKAVISTAEVEITSFKESLDVAIRTPELIFFPIFLKNPESHSFTIIEIIRTDMLNIPTSADFGEKIFSTELFKREPPRISMTKDTAIQEIYSTLACPYGWSSSAGFPEIINPIREMKEVPASEKLFTASARIETEPKIIPASPFITLKNILQIIPITEAKFPYFTRLLSSFSEKNSFKSRVVILIPPGNLLVFIIYQFS